MNTTVPVFTNTENECVKTEDGREVWLSRSMAITGIIVAFSCGEPFVLISKRGKGTPDFQGLQNVVCGYVDQKETLYEAVRREIWEETGVNIKHYQDLAETSHQQDKHQSFLDSFFYNNYEEPAFINDDKEANRGNITMGYVFKINCDAFDQIKVGEKYKSNLPILSDKYCEPDEVEDLEWLPFNPKAILEREFAFSHEKRLLQVYDQLYTGNSVMVGRNRIINSLGASVRIDKDFK